MCEWVWYAVGDGGQRRISMLFLRSEAVLEVRGCDGNLQSNAGFPRTKAADLIQVLHALLISMNLLLTEAMNCRLVDFI